MATVITRASKQKRMKQFYEMNKQHSMFYLCVAYDDRWSNRPITPLETDIIEENDHCKILGYQTCENIKFVQVIMNPTEAEKADPNNIYYKDSYYKTLTNLDEAIAQGYTRLMLTFILNKDEYIPVENPDGSAVVFNQLGLYTEVDPGSLPDTYFITTEEFEQLENPGLLEIIDNRSIQSRAEDQKEEIYLMVEF